MSRVLIFALTVLALPALAAEKLATPQNVCIVDLRSVEQMAWAPTYDQAARFVQNTFGKMGMRPPMGDVELINTIDKGIMEIAYLTAEPPSQKVTEQLALANRMITALKVILRNQFPRAYSRAFDN